ncbi:P-loop containing nucleoside triphosphate hydrolase protein [Chaetomium fimeti]|uniref:P-loop containing nucleoside triphosphate hydrolase protein n=1 Tax=Chaetomium fimeti TaxID=1854472 RepID=A0AAE0H6I1_9PEZI|nr:P-loop containing nucleoside triphosphate hydrolase protein [Chaetomium fimeti]
MSAALSTPGPGPAPAAAPGPAPAQQKAVWFKDCVILFGGSQDSPAVAGRNAPGSAHKIRSRAISSRFPHTNPWVGFDLNFPLPQRQAVNEQAGFGVRYNLDRKAEGGVALAQAEDYEVTVRFPRGQTRMSVEAATPALVKRIPAAVSLVSVTIHEDANVKVTGFGMPFRNPEDPVVDGWVNRNAPIVDGITLLDVLAQRTFHVVLPVSCSAVEKEWNDARLPPPFSYPYGTEHTLRLDEKGIPDMSQYARLLEDTKSREMFRPAFSYDDDNSHVAVVTQTVVQDEFWLHRAAGEIATVKSPAYFVDHGQGRYYVIVALRKSLMEEYGAAWRRLSKDNEVRLNIEVEGATPCRQSWYVAWSVAQCMLLIPIRLCTIVDHPDQDIRTNHPVEDYELARKVDSTCVYLSGAGPTRDLPYRRDPAEAHGKERMELHRAVMRGQGFYDWMIHQAAKDHLVEAMASVSDVSAPPARPARRLPAVNFLAADNEAYINALFEEILPGDRAPFREYLTNRFLGIGIVTAAPGFGKTTLMAVAGLAMEASIGQVLASGPSNVAVDNLAGRLDRVSRSVCARYNEGKTQEDRTRERYRLVVRGYTPDLEKTAFLRLLENRDWVPPVVSGQRQNSWTLELSLAYWLLILLGCPEDRFGTLHPDASEKLHGLQAEFNDRGDLRSIRAVAAGEMMWQTFRTTEDVGSIYRNVLGGLMKQIVDITDILAITPAKAGSPAYHEWVNRTARCVIIDEAANMHRSDVGCLWGNCLAPVFFGGDPRQLWPTVITGMEKDPDGNLYHRLATDGGISPLSFLAASGLPVYRLRIQLRIAEGLFDWVAEHLYSEVNFTYGPSCAIVRPQFQAGHVLERLLRSYPGVRPSPPGKFLPVFLHCEGAYVHVDPRTGSKRCPDQVEEALRFAAKLAGEGVNAAKITILSPYAANVELIRRMRKLPAYRSLMTMGDASTVDAFQGQENDIVIVVMGTAFPQPGPGFTTDPHRLNVLLTRQRCGLVVVGDIDIRPADGNGATGAGHGFLVVSPEGERQWRAAPMLQHIHASMLKHGRVARLPGPAAGS